MLNNMEDKRLPKIDINKDINKRLPRRVDTRMPSLRYKSLGNKERYHIV
jgi:hypothetical protein